MVYGLGGSKALTRNIEVPEADRRHFCLNDEDILTLTQYALTIEEHYSKKAGENRPMDIEWAKDGLSGELFIVQARPETVRSGKSLDVLETYYLDGHGPLLATGKSVGEKIGSGKARIIKHTSQLAQFVPGEVFPRKPARKEE